jgi:excisionase family DNA binding protein
MTAPRKSYSTVEIARRLGVSIQTVQRWVDAGRLKAWKTLGGHRRIDADSAEALLRHEVPVERATGPKQNETWLTRGEETATVIDTNAPGEFPVISRVPHAITGYRLIFARADGTADSRPGVAHRYDLVRRLS